MLLAQQTRLKISVNASTYGEIIQRNIGPVLPYEAKYKLALLAFAPMSIATMLSIAVSTMANHRALRATLDVQASRRLALQVEQIRSYVEQHVRALRILTATSVLQGGSLESIKPQLAFSARSPEIEGSLLQRRRRQRARRAWGLLQCP
ncbi:MAG: hypothetical protein U1D30_21635 [Planctomycetota bacterium]